MTAAVNTLEDFNPDPNSPAGIAAHWISELDLSDQYYSDYWKRCRMITDRYRDKQDNAFVTAQKRRLSVLWSNIETLKPACYAKVPNCVVLRRFKDADPVGRVASEVLERAIEASLDSYDFDQVLKSVRDDFLLYARGIPWVRYTAEFGPAPTGMAGASGDSYGEPDIKGGPTSGLGKLVNGAKSILGLGKPETVGSTTVVEKEGAGTPEEIVTNERTICDHVCLNDFRTNAARNWSEVRWGSRLAYMSRAALKKRFGDKIGGQVPLDWKPENQSSVDAQKAEQFNKACIYEIWDKDSGKVYWISKSWPQAPLDVRKDPLGLKDFFPFPKPAFGTLAADALIPIPDYIYYQDQANEVDELTLRINILTKAMRMVGLYAADEKTNLQNVFRQSAENEMIPVDTWAAFKEKGGVQGVVEWVPVQQIAFVLKQLNEIREENFNLIYQITGISDIMRGDTDPNETAAAQGLKSTWGSSRVREKQKEMARIARDIMRIMGEIIAEKYSIDTLKRMTNVKLLTNSEKQQIMQWQQAAAAMQAQQQAMQQQMMAQVQPGAPPPQMPAMQPPPPPFPEDMMKLMDQPSWEDVKELLENESKRMFRIDVEANSTIDIDMARAQAEADKFLTGLGTLIAQSLEAVKSAPALGELTSEAVKFYARQYQVGRQFEETIDRTLSNIAKQPATPPEGAEAAKGPSPQELAIEQERVKVEAEELKVRREEIAANAENNRFDAQTNALSVQAERERTAADERIAAMELQMQRMSDMLEAMTRRHETNVDAGIRRYEADSQPAPSMNGAGA